MRPTLIAAIVTAFLAAGCGNEKTGPESKSKDNAGKAEEHAGEKLVRLSTEDRKRSGVRVEAAGETELSGELSLTATVQPNQDALAHVAPRVPGRIVAVYARLGDRVKAGQPLALLDSLEVGKAQSAYRQSASEASLASAAFERAERLHAEQVMPTKDWQRARFDHERTRAQLAAAADKLRMLGVAPQGDKAVSTFPVVAPIGGIITEKHAVLGELAKVDEFLYSVADLSTLWIEANVAERDLRTVKLGAAAKVKVAAWPDESFDGRVAYVGATLEKETRTILARIEVPNRDGRLKPEMFATVLLAKGGAAKSLTVAESAVTLIQGLPTVFVEEGQAFEARPVELGERGGGRVAIKSGLNSGERVVVEGVYALKARVLKSQIGDGH